MRFIFVLMLLSVGAQASRETGNGGDGYRIGGKLYLLDFVESGRERNPYLSNTVTLHPGLTQRIAKVLANLPDAPVTEVATKVSEIYAIDRVAAVAIVKSMEFYSWLTVRYELPNVEDEQSLVPPPYQQLAIRRGSSIYIQEALWGELDPANRAGLIFHEIIYAMQPPMEVNDGERAKYFQYSYKAREYVSYLFNPLFEREDIWRFSTRAFNVLPISHYQNYEQQAEPKEFIYQLGSHSELSGTYERRDSVGISGNAIDVYEPGIRDAVGRECGLEEQLVTQCRVSRNEAETKVTLATWKKEWLYDIQLSPLSGGDVMYVRWKFGNYSSTERQRFEGQDTEVKEFKSCNGNTFLYDVVCAQIVDSEYRKMFPWAQ